MKCQCRAHRKDLVGVSPHLLQCEKCGALWSDKPEATRPIARTPFRVGMAYDDMRSIVKRTWRILIKKPEPLNYKDDPIAQKEALDLKVRHDYSDGVYICLARQVVESMQPFYIYEIGLQSDYAPEGPPPPDPPEKTDQTDTPRFVECPQCGKRNTIEAITCAGCGADLPIEWGPE